VDGGGFAVEEKGQSTGVLVVVITLPSVGITGLTLSSILNIPMSHASCICKRFTSIISTVSNIGIKYIYINIHISSHPHRIFNLCHPLALIGTFSGSFWASSMACRTGTS
jgi:hypothetical protein